jgi:hypothetical protein
MLGEPSVAMGHELDDGGTIWYKRPPPVPLTGKIVEEDPHDTDSFTFPENPLRLFSVMLDVDDPRAMRVRDDGVAVRLKSRMATRRGKGTTRVSVCPAKL